jgi:hypothetical protein
MQAGMDRSRARGVGSVFDKTGRANGSMADSSRTVCRNEATTTKPFFKQGLKCSMFRKEEFSEVEKGILRFGKVIC